MRPILTAIGEVGIHAGGRTYMLRPSLFAMSRLGSPEEIVETYTHIMGGAKLPPPLNAEQVAAWPGRLARVQFSAALAVLHACAEDDLSEARLVGGINERGDYTGGAVPPRDIVVLAQSLMRHGVNGDQEPGGDDEYPEERGEYSARFDPREHAAAAMAHLGATEAEAWAMTMTSLVGGLKSKYPVRRVDSKGKPVPPKPSLKQYDQAAEWLAEINRKRANG